MAKKAYIGVDGKARKVKKGYVGVDGKARKIKKAYIGIGGGATYREVECIESTGTQYIDTGVYPSKTIQVDVTIKPNTSYMSEHSVLGSDWSLNGFFLMFYQNMIRFHSCGANVDVTSFNTSGKNVISCSSSRLSVNGTAYNLSGTGSDANYPIRLFSVYNEGSYSSKRGHFSLYSCQIYDNGKLIRDYVPCISPDGTAGLFDKVSKHFYGNAGSDSFVSGMETGNVYVSNGIARPCWSGGELAYYGKITPLKEPAIGLSATTVGNYALFAGGYENEEGFTVATVNTYNTSLTMGTTGTATLQEARHGMAAATVGNYAIFAGGINTGNSVRRYVDAYNSSLSFSKPDQLSNAKHDFAATSVGNYALFAGGRGSTSTSSSLRSTTDAYNASLTHSTPTVLSAARYGLAATRVGNYALFGGGKPSSGYSGVIDCYDSSLTYKKLSSGLIIGRFYLAATTVGDYAIFAGGKNTVASDSVDILDSSLTRYQGTFQVMGKSRASLSATSVGKYALFAGGSSYGSDTYYADVDVYDTSITKTTLYLNGPRAYLAATTVGDYALFGGGEGTDDTMANYKTLNTVEAFTVD